MNIIDTHINDITPYTKNPRHNAKAVEIVKTSLKEYGFKQPIVVDKNMEIVVGHTRFAAAKDLGYTTVPVLIADDLNAEQINAYRIMDNRSSEFSEWDDTLLVEELSDLINKVDIEITGFTEKDLFDMTHTDDENPYTQKIQVPTYEPHGVKPHIEDCYDSDWCEQLLAEIKSSDLPPEEKTLLTLAAYRHTKFDYENIAEYYCHASPVVQRLMERSAMVIVDFDQALELGYVKLSKELAEAYRTDHET